MSPPMPPSPPSGPPYSTYFSRRKATAPGPPLPERMKIFAWSRKCMMGDLAGWRANVAHGLRQAQAERDLGLIQCAENCVSSSREWWLSGQSALEGNTGSAEKLPFAGRDGKFPVHWW